MIASTPNEQLTARTGKPRLLAVGYWVPATGFTRVLQSILTPLAQHYEIHVIGIAYKGPPLHGALNVYPCNLNGGDVFGVYQARDLVAALQPAIVFLLNDIWILSKYLPLLAPLQQTSSIVCYCPLDGTLPDGALLEPFAALAPNSRFVVYTEFARQEIARVSAALRCQDPTFSLPPVVALPHGVDTAAFYPLAGSVAAQLAPGGRAAARRRVFPQQPDLVNAFLVLNANRAQPRKRIDLTIDGFAQFARAKPPNVKLVLHHAVVYGDERAESERLIGVAGIADRVLLIPASAQPPDDATLNLIYNACDVGLNTAMGEGWGMISFEHAASGAAQIVPRHSACAELWDGAAELLDAGPATVPSFSRLALAPVTAAGVAAALERLYSDPAHLGKMADAAYHNATSPAYRWERIAADWQHLFIEVTQSAWH